MRPKIIVFTGIDGAGKTTHARLLVKYLNGKKVPPKYVHLTAPEFKIIGWLENKFSKKILEKENKFLLKDNSKNLNIFLKSLGLLFLFRGIFQSWIKIIRNKNFSLVVFDRYAYDDLIRTAWKYRYSIDKLISLIRLVPKPDIIFNLTLSSEEAWKREKEGYISLEQLRQKKNCHDAFINRINRVVDIDASMADIEKTQEEIRNVIHKSHENMFSCTKGR